MIYPMKEIMEGGRGEEAKLMEINPTNHIIIKTTYR
jgi:hypothetical protein